MNLIKYKKNILYVLLTILPAAIWSLRLYSEWARAWATDFGNHFVGAKLISSRYVLYLDHCENHGPIHYLFVKVIMFFLGDGHVQAWAALWLGTCFYFGAVVWVCIRQKLSVSFTLFCVFAAWSLILFQPTNASIGLFQAGFTIVFFYSFVSTIAFSAEDSSLKSKIVWGYFLLTIVSFTLSVLIKVDSLFYLPILFLLSWFSSKKYKTFVIRITLVVIIPLAFFWVIKRLIFFSLSDWIDLNILVNLNYPGRAYPDKSFLVQLIYRPLQYSLLLKNGFFFLLGICGYGFWSNRKNAQKQVDLALLLVFGMSVLLWMNTRTEKESHLVALFPGILVPLLFYCHKVPVQILCLFITLVAAPFGVDLSTRTTWKKLGVYGGVEESEVIEYLKKNPNTPAFGISPWIYLLSGSEPKLGLVENLSTSKRYLKLNAFTKTRLWMDGFAKEHSNLIVPMAFSKGSRLLDDHVDSLARWINESEELYRFGNKYILYGKTRQK